MVRSFRRGAYAAVLALSLASLAACSAGNGAGSLQIKPDSASGIEGPIEVQNAFVLTQASGPATVSARLYNNGTTAQTLESVKVAGSPAAVSGAHGGKTVTVPAHGSVLLGGKGNPVATIDTGSESLRDGDVQTAVFVFSRTGQVAVAINVTPATGYFKPFGPGSLPTTAAPTPSGAATPTGSPAPGATDTATPTGTQTGTPTGTPSGTPTDTATDGTTTNS